MDPSLNTVSQEKLFIKNFQYLQKTNPALAYQLQMADPSKVEFCWTEENELNIKRHYQNCTYFYHSQINALQEAKEWFHSLDLHLATVIFVYGIGLGYYYEAAKSWLDQNQHRHLIFLEEDLNILYRLCETDIGFRLLKDTQVKVVFLKDKETDNLVLNELAWTYFNSPYLFSSLELYYQVNPEGFKQLKHDLTFRLVQIHDLVEEYEQYGIAFYRNFYPNLLELPSSFLGNGLFNCFSDVPAIICGAGPSLNKNLVLISTLKDKALIFGGSSSLKALLSKEIIPHFGVAIDPNKAQYSRVAATKSLQIPFFYRNRLFHEALLAIKGAKLYLTGAGGYEAAHWFERQLNIEGEDLEEGLNVVNFSVQIAKALGCNPIILVGVDLAYTDKKLYAEGITDNLDAKEENFSMPDKHDPSLILREDIYGKPVYTLWKWVAESKWISEFAQLHSDVKIINATEGGLGFEDIDNIRLEEVIEEYIKSPRKEIKDIDNEIQKHSLAHINREDIVNLLQEMKNSLDHCIFLLSRLLEVETETTNPTALSLLESDLEEEIGYQYVLNTFNTIYMHTHHRETKNFHINSQNEVEFRKQRLVFLRDVAHCNRELILLALHH